MSSNDVTVIVDDESTQQEEEKPLMKRSWRVWPGDNKFWCDGLFLSGPDWKSQIFTFVIIVIPCGVFIAFPCMDFVNRKEYGYIYLIVTILLLVATMITFFVTALSDPGIIPRGQYGMMTRERRREIDRILPPRAQQVLIDGHLITLKFCDTCQIFRPTRCVHCSDCNNCVEVFDHHCPWVGNCVGKRNYRSFILFLMSTFCLSSWCLTISIWDVVMISQEFKDEGYNSQEAFKRTLERNPTAFILCFFVFCCTLFVTGLSTFHMFLMCRGETTNEYLKEEFPLGSPYHRGYVRNIIGLLCRGARSRASSNVRLRHKTPVTVKMSGTPVATDPPALGGGLSSNADAPFTMPDMPNLNPNPPLILVGGKKKKEKPVFTPVVEQWQHVKHKISYLSVDEMVAEDTADKIKRRKKAGQTVEELKGKSVAVTKAHMPVSSSVSINDVKLDTSLPNDEIVMPAATIKLVQEAAKVVANGKQEQKEEINKPHDSLTDDNKFAHEFLDRLPENDKRRDPNFVYGVDDDDVYHDKDVYNDNDLSSDIVETDSSDAGDVAGALDGTVQEDDSNQDRIVLVRNPKWDPNFGRE